MKEQTKEWKPVVGYEGLYEVSSDGDVRSVKTGRVLKPRMHKNGYLQLCLCHLGITKTFSIHRLVAESFVPNHINKGDVNHINGVKSDNRMCNLEWATRSENVQHAWKSGLKEKTRMSFSNSNSKMVIDLWSGIFYKSLKEACDATDCNYGASRMQIWKKYKTQRFQYI